MVHMNEYFEGKVKSLTVNAQGERKTVGVMEAGEYEFGTALKEVMTIITGALTVLLPNQTTWQTHATGSSFEVPASSTFTVKAAEDTAYLCAYIAE